MTEEQQENKGVVVSSETPMTPADAKPQSTVRKQPRYWIRLSVFLVPLLLSEIMFWHAGRLWEVIIFPIAWVGFFYFQMRRGGWNVFKP